MVETVLSADGTPIAFERAGEGPAVLVMTGALNTRRSSRALVAELEPDYTVFVYDRRARGDSGDTKPYAPEREVEDVLAVIGAIGGAPLVYGHSSGGVLAIKAAIAGAPISKLALYEPPYLSQVPGRASPEEYLERVDAALAADDPGLAVEIFFDKTGYSREQIDELVAAKYWPSMVALGHTVPYDFLTLGDAQPPLEAMAAFGFPVLAMGGEDGRPWPAKVANAIAGAVPHGRVVIFDGEGHAAPTAKLAALLREFFTE